jgi:hypothetical protein
MSIQTAIDDMDSAERDAAERARIRNMRIAQFKRLERLLEDVETHNLARDRVVTEAMWQELHNLDDVLPVRAPARLWTSRNTARLHGAILDWEAEILDQVAPQRLLYDDRRDEQ